MREKTCRICGAVKVYEKHSKEWRCPGCHNHEDRGFEYKINGEYEVKI